MKNIMHYSFVIWLFLIFLMVVGCASDPYFSYRMPSTRPPEIREGVGTIGIVSANFTPESYLPKHIFAGKAITGGVAGGALEGATLGLFLPLANPFSIFILPISVGVGAAAGALVGGTAGGLLAPSQLETEMAGTSIKNASEEFKIQEVMRDLIKNKIQEQTQYKLVLIEGEGSTTLDEAVSYDPLKGKGIDTVLEISVRKYGFWSEGGINPPLSFFMTASTRLIRLTDGEVLHSETFRYEKGQRKFVDWGANNAQPFREELDLCSQYLARKIIRKVFFISGSGEGGDSSSNLVEQDRNRIVSKSHWIEGVCGSSGKGVTWHRGALVVTDQQVSFLAWDGNDYDMLLEFDYDEIRKVEVKTFIRRKSLVIYTRDNCFTFELRKSPKNKSGVIDGKTTVKMADFISKKIELKE